MWVFRTQQYVHFVRISFFCRCQVVIKVFEDANKLSVADSTCPECDARQLQVEYRPVRLSHTLCYFTGLTDCAYWCRIRANYLEAKRRQQHVFSAQLSYLSWLKYVTRQWRNVVEEGAVDARADDLEGAAARNPKIKWPSWLLTLCSRWSVIPLHGVEARLYKPPIQLSPDFVWKPKENRKKYMKLHS